MEPVFEPQLAIMDARRDRAPETLEPGQDRASMLVAGHAPTAAGTPWIATGAPDRLSADETCRAVALDAGALAGDAIGDVVGRIARRGRVISLALPQELLATVVPLAARFPDASFVIERTGAPHFMDADPATRDALERQWLDDLAKLAGYPNVTVELGGLPAGDARDSDALFDRWAGPIREAIEIFGPDRAMFATRAVSAQGADDTVVWNAFKKITLGLGSAARAALFAGTARRVYGLPPL